MKLKLYIFLFFIFSFGFAHSQSLNNPNNGPKSAIISKKKLISIYPNPVSDFFKIESTQIISKIEIYNLIGKKIKSITDNKSGLYDVSGLRNGMYLIRLFDENNNVLKVLRLGVNNETP